jgi:hypothetical protein
VKRERDTKADDKGDVPAMDVDEQEGGSSSTEEVDQVKSQEEEDDEEEQGSKRARVELGPDEANQAMLEVKAELEYHAEAWRNVHLGKRGELQPQGRAREAELPGDHTTAVDSSGRHIMVDGSETEALARLAVVEADDQGKKTVFNSARMIVRLAPTPLVPDSSL